MSGWQSDPAALALPWTESPFFAAQLEARLRDGRLGEADAAQLRGFARDGYLVLDAPMADAALCQRIGQELRGRYTDPATGYSEGSRVQDAWRWNAAVARLATQPCVLKLLALLYQRLPIPFQTLNFERGTQQRAHSDTIHFDSIPHGFMCGVWVALEDVDADNGPLFYVPGSHHLPRFDLHDIGVATGYRHYREYEDFVAALVDGAGLERRPIPLRRGQALIWAANLIHGGSPIVDPERTRLSQVTHYYFENCLYYQPLGSDAALGELALKRVVDIRTGRAVANRYRGQPVSALRQRPRKSLGQLAGALGHRVSRWTGLPTSPGSRGRTPRP